MEKNSRALFIDTLTELAERDPTVMLVVCDVGFSFIEDFAKKFPKQFINAGVTEQMATGMCAGLAYSGMKPYLYSMINFVTMRNYEQLRNDICYGNANVKVIGVQGSTHYKFLGFSHNIVNDEDIKIVSHLPNIYCFVPRTEKEVEMQINDSYTNLGPIYIRL